MNSPSTGSHVGSMVKGVALVVLDVGSDVESELDQMLDRHWALL